jgi:hypothetical protein
MKRPSIEGEDFLSPMGQGEQGEGGVLKSLGGMSFWGLLLM